MYPTLLEKGMSPGIAPMYSSGQCQQVQNGVPILPMLEVRNHLIQAWPRDAILGG